MCVQCHFADIKENGLYKVPKMWVSVWVEMEFQY